MTEQKKVERQLTSGQIELVENAIRIELHQSGWDHGPQIEGSVKRVRSRLLAPKPVERVIIEPPSASWPDWRVFVDGSVRAWCRSVADADFVAKAIRAELAKQEGT